MSHPNGQDRAAHWEQAYTEGDTGRSWYQEHAHTSLELIQELADVQDAIIDIGGGASTLTDDLIGAGFTDISVLDISQRAIEIARARVGSAGAAVTWLVGDLASWDPPRSYDIWHDRAVLHFFVHADQQAEYRRVLLQATHVGSGVVIGVFGPDGPEQCSGLPVRRYGEADLAEFLGPNFTVNRSQLSYHSTPAGGTQQFLWLSATRT